MDEVSSYTLAFALAVASLPLISYGSMNSVETAWTIGFVLLVVSAVIPVVVRYVEKFGSPA